MLLSSPQIQVSVFGVASSLPLEVAVSQEKQVPHGIPAPLCGFPSISPHDAALVLSEIQRTNWWVSEGRAVWGGWMKKVKGRNRHKLPVIK